MDSHYTALGAAILVLLAFSMYFSGTETAFTSFNRVKVKNMALEGNRRAALVLRLAENYDRLLSAVLIGNNIVNIAMASIATLLLVDLYGPRGALISTALITLIILIFAEFTPKVIAREIPERFCLTSAPLARALLFALTPLTFLFGRWKALIARVFSLHAEKTITGEELLTIVEEAETEGGINTEHSELIQNAIEFNELEAWDVLTPRVDVIAIEMDISKEEISEVFKRTGFSRLPVYEESIDKIVGVLNQKDFSNYIAGTDKAVGDYVKPVVFMTGSVKIAALLKKMQRIKTHIAVIVDEYGGTEGIVTMEDIIEELVGEIFDEHDEETAQEILPQQDGSYRVMCSANIEKMLNYFDIEEEEARVTTVNGWVVVALDKLPQVGDSFRYKHLLVTVTKADEKKALEIAVTKEPLDQQ